MNFALQAPDQAQLRQEMLKYLRSLSREVIEEKSSRLSARLNSFLSAQATTANTPAQKHLGVFSSLSTEPQLQPLLKSQIHLTKKFQWCFPLVAGDQLHFFEADRFRLSALGVLEPEIDLTSQAEKECFPEIILVPGVVFHPCGARIGRGKGYYDRYIAKRKILKIGLCFKEQMMNELWTEGHDDQRVDLIITDVGLLNCKE